MTPHTDRKSADILAALDKLAENGMPFIDVVKRDGFSGWGVSPVDSAKHVAAQEARNQRFDPLRGCTVQIHEDPGAAYWKEVNDFMDKFDQTHTDRIRQMAQEAGIQSPEQYDGHSQDCPWMATTDELTRFAQLVAEDCAKVADGLASFDWESAASAHRIDQAIRARYSLKD